MKKKNSKKTIVIIISVTIVLIIVGIFVFQRQQATKARKEYIDNLNTVSLTMLDGGVMAEKTCNLAYLVWYNSIHKEKNEDTDPYILTGSGYNDFNTSLGYLYASDDMVTAIENMKANQEKVAEILKQLKNPTPEFEKTYDVIDLMYSSYYNLTNLAISPSGNLNEFSSNYKSYINSFLEQHDKLELLMPEEK